MNADHTERYTHKLILDIFGGTILIQVSQAYKASVHDLPANHGFQVMPV